MAWVQCEIQEGGLPYSLGNLLLQHGWREVTTFTKVVYDAALSKPNVIEFVMTDQDHRVAIARDYLEADAYAVLINDERFPAAWEVTAQRDGLLFNSSVLSAGDKVTICLPSCKPDEKTPLHVAKHHILLSENGDLFGIALWGYAEHTLTAYPYNCSQPDGTWKLQNDAFLGWAKEHFYDELARRDTLFVYQLERFDNPSYEDAAIPWPAADDGKRIALDTEVHSAAWRYPELKFEVTRSYPDNFQSPIIALTLRPESESGWDESIGAYVQRSNYWSDSQVRVKGFVDGKTAVLLLNSDTAPEWEHNVTPSVPLYMGMFDLLPDAPTAATDIVQRSRQFDARSGERKTVTIATSLPMVEEGSYADVWTVGDLDSDAEYGHTAIDGVPWFHTHTGEKVLDLPKERTDPLVRYLGKMPLVNIDGKTQITVDYWVDPECLIARIWMDFHIVTKQPLSNACLFGGTSVPEPFDPDDPATTQPVMVPSLKQYPYHPSNGVDSIMVKRTKYGARYQSYYLSWDQPPHLMPPPRANRDAKYPRAWQGAGQAAYRYQYNPSRYTNKVHSSKVYLYHPELGKHGSLRGVILMPPLSILDGDEVREWTACCTGRTDGYVTYSYHLAEGLSPVTKRPATQYRPAGMGIRMTPFAGEN